MCSPAVFYGRADVQFMMRAELKGWSVERARRAWAFIQWRKERHLDAFCDHFGPLADAQLASEGNPRKALRPTMEVR